MRVSIIRHGQAEAETLATRSFSFTFSESVRGPPWHRLSTTVGIAMADALRGKGASARDWIALETEPGFARALGRVSDVQFQSSDGPIARSTMTVTAEGFLDAAKANDVISVGTRAGEETIGTLFGYEDWLEKTIKSYVDTFSRGDLGRLLQDLVKTIVRIRAPDLLLGQTNLGDAIYVLHATKPEADGSAEMIGSRRVLDPVAGFNVGGVRSFLKTQAKAIELLTGTFAPSALLIELFPSLEPFTLDARASVAPTVLGNYLTIVYRIKPWRAEALTDATQPRNAGPAPGTSGPPGGGLVNPFFTPEKFPEDAFSFDRVTWLPERAVLVGPPLSFNGRLSNDDIVNAATAQLAAMGGDDSLRVMRALGLPILAPNEEVERDGLRAAAVLWPFMPAAGTEEDKAGGRVRAQDVLAFTQRVAAQVMQFYKPAAELLTGNVMVGLDLRVRAGELVKIPIGGELLVGYVDAVEHRLDSDARGVVTGTTTINYSRGAIDESKRRVTFELPPVDMSFMEDSDVDEGGRHEGLVFGGVEYLCALDWPWIYAATNVPVDAARRMFVFGDSEPTQTEIKTFVAGSAAGVHPVVAAKGESYGARRPSCERLAVSLGASLRDPSVIDKVILHSPGGKHTASACYNAAGTYVGNYQRGKQVAAHFIIDRKGCVWQMLDALRYAGHSLGYYDDDDKPTDSTDFVNRTSIGIDVVVGSSHLTFAEHRKLRSNGWELPNPDPYALNGAPDPDSILGGNYPEGGLNEVTLQRAHMNIAGLGDFTRVTVGGRALQRARYTQPSRHQYRALGALLSPIKRVCPNFQHRFPGQDGLNEFTWRAVPTSTRDGHGYYDEGSLKSGIYVHATLSRTRTDHIGLNRSRVLAYCATGADERNARTRGDTL